MQDCFFVTATIRQMCVYFFIFQALPPTLMNPLLEGTGAATLDHSPFVGLGTSDITRSARAIYGTAKTHAKADSYSIKNNLFDDLFVILEIKFSQEAEGAKGKGKDRRNNSLTLRELILIVYPFL